jgi:hypothetical protein
VQVGDEVVDLAGRENVSEGRHDLAAMHNLPPHRCLRYPFPYVREIGTLMPANIVNGVAVPASAHLEDRGAARPLAAGRGEREGCASRKRENNRQPQLH